MWILHRPDFQFSFPIIELFLSSEKGVVLLQDEEDLRKYWTHLSCFSNVRRKNVKRSLLRFSKSCLDFLVLELQGVKSWDLEPFSLFWAVWKRVQKYLLDLRKVSLRELWAGCKKRRWRWSSSGRKSAAWTLKMELSGRQEMVWNQKKATYGHRPQKSCMKADISIWCYETRSAAFFTTFLPCSHFGERFTCHGSFMRQSWCLLSLILSDIRYSGHPLDSHWKNKIETPFLYTLKHFLRGKLWGELEKGVLNNFRHVTQQASWAIKHSHKTA